MPFYVETIPRLQRLAASVADRTIGNIMAFEGCCQSGLQRLAASVADRTHEAGAWVRINPWSSTPSGFRR